MKHIFYIALVFLLIGCDSDKGLNCFQAAGSIVQEERSVEEFTEIVVFERTQLIIQQGETQSVVVESGENLLNDIEVEVTEGVLEIRNDNGCNLVRDYGITKVFVTAPNIIKIRNSSGLQVESIGTLRFATLSLVSEDQENEDAFHIDGDFRLDLEVESLNIVANGLSNFYLSGTATRADFGLFAGDGRIEAANLIVQNLSIFHRSTQKMIVNPQQSIRGTIYSLGDVIAKTRPPIVEMEELFRGRLIFEQ